MRDYITAVETISTNETIINEILILSEKVYMKRFYHEL